jgi:putative membrane protein
MFMGMIPIIVLIAAVVWWLTKGDKANERGVAIKETPLEILKRRYADGEIAKEQFESMKKVLEG